MNGKTTIYHPNAKGTGSALQLELVPAHDGISGRIIFRFFSQKTIGGWEDGKRIFPEFDWDCPIEVGLGQYDIAKILEVLRGYTEKCNNGAGLLFSENNCDYVLVFEHRLEPVPGYSMRITKAKLGKISRENFFLSLAEALVMEETFSQSMIYLMFGANK